MRMLAKLKLIGYGLLSILALWFAWGFYVNYSAVNISNSAYSSSAAGDDSTGENKGAAAQGATNQPGTNAVEDIADAGTNAAALAATDAAETNLALLSATNSEGKPTNHSTAGTVKKRIKKSTSVKGPEARRIATAETRKSMIANLGALVGVAILLGIMIAFDFSHYVAGRGVDMLFDDDGAAGKDPEYERAEQVWADGNHMEAVQMMRDYLKKNPREQYVAIRIAEIYEKDFKNYLAAAMEYEEILKCKLPAERWGWAAIHLCNLYSKIGREVEYKALLERIVAQHPQTAAAKKARQRLGMSEEAEMETSSDVGSSGDTPPEPPPAPSNLPPGFRPK